LLEIRIRDSPYKKELNKMLKPTIGAQVLAIDIRENILKIRFANFSITLFM